MNGSARHAPALPHRQTPVRHNITCYWHTSPSIGKTCCCCMCCPPQVRQALERFRQHPISHARKTPRLQPLNGLQPPRTAPVPLGSGHQRSEQCSLGLLEGRCGALLLGEARKAEGVGAAVARHHAHGGFVREACRLAHSKGAEGELCSHTHHCRADSLRSIVAGQTASHMLCVCKPQAVPCYRHDQCSHVVIVCVQATGACLDTSMTSAQVPAEWDVLAAMHIHSSR